METAQAAKQYKHILSHQGIVGNILNSKGKKLAPKRKMIRTSPNKLEKQYLLQSGAKLGSCPSLLHESLRRSLPRSPGIDHPCQVDPPGVEGQTPRARARGPPAGGASAAPKQRNFGVLGGPFGVAGTGKPSKLLLV